MSVQPHDFVDLPFLPPPDFSLDLPVPPSVNRLRKVNWAATRKLTAWKNVADGYVMAARGRSHQPLPSAPLKRFEITVIMSERHARLDLDNGLKALIDYLRRIEVIEDDGKEFMRRLTVEWGVAHFGCRVIVRPVA